MNTGRRFLVRCTLALTLASLWCAAHRSLATPAQDAIAPWTFSFKKGDVQKFRTYIRVTARNTDDNADIVLTAKSTSHHTITEVADDGTAKWDQLDDSSAVTINGMALPSDEVPKPVAITFTKNGVITKRVNPAGDPFAPAEKAIQIIQSLPTPTAAMKPGESWTTELDNVLLKNRKVTVKSTLVGAIKMLGRDALQIQMKTDFSTAYGTDPDDISHITTTYFVDATTHELLRVRYTILNALLPFPAKKVQAHGLVSRIVPGQNDTEDADGEKLLKGEEKPAAGN